MRVCLVVALGGGCRRGVWVGGGRRTVEIAELSVGFGPVVLAPKRRFMMADWERRFCNGYVEGMGN